MDNLLNSGPFIGNEVFAYRHKDHSAVIMVKAVLLSCAFGAAVFLAL